MSEPLRVVLLGATLDTGNLGVSALAEASVACIRRAAPGARVDFVGLSRERGVSSVPLREGAMTIRSWPVRFCRDLRVPDHFLKIAAQCRRARRGGGDIDRIPAESTAGVLVRADRVFDITGGDSFSDLYGVKRFLLGYLTKRLCQKLGVGFVLLPQTYGPFKGAWARLLARRVLRHSTTILSRDAAGVERVRSLAGPQVPVRLVPDVAFTLEPRCPREADRWIDEKRPSNQTRIGINVSGLLWHGGYHGGNQFGLLGDYRALMRRCLAWALERPASEVLLVPHVIPPAGRSVENDHEACQDLLAGLDSGQAGRVRCVAPGLDQAETKWLIGRCDFFMGARMHATIAALSQEVPAVGLAYSDKFAGVFETVGLADAVVDLRALDEQAAVAEIDRLFQRRGDLRQRLRDRVGEVKRQVQAAFDDELQR